MDKFEVHLLSTASLEIFGDYTLAAFKNQLPQNVSLEGDWRVAPSEKNFPSGINNVYTDFFYYVHTTKKKEDEENLDEIDEEKAEEIEIDSEPVAPYYQKLKIRPSMYSHINNLLFEMRSKVNLLNLLTEDGKHRSTENGLEIKFDAYAGYTFPNRNIPNLLGFKGKETAFGIHIGNEDILNSRWVVNDFPVDLIYGIRLILVYTDLIEYQKTGDVKAPVLRIIDSGKRVESGKVVTIQNLETRSFFDLQYKKLLVQNIQTIGIQLRKETGILVPFCGKGQVVLTLKLKKFAKWKTITQSKCVYPISPVTTDNEVEELVHWQSVLAEWLCKTFHFACCKKNLAKNCSFKGL